MKQTIEIFSEQTIQHVLMAFQCMDVVRVATFLNDDGCFLNTEKSTFVSLLKTSFFSLKAFGNHSLQPSDGRCSFSSGECRSYVFSANASKHYLALNLVFHENTVSVVTECYCLHERTQTTDFEYQLFVDPSRGASF